MIDLIFSFWYVWVLFIVAGIFSIFKPRILGFLGEKTVSVILSTLDPGKYKVINDIIIDTNGTTSQIDHVVVSNYGVFVIETKNYKGWIYGDEYSQYWTQKIYRHKEKLYNPIRQNYGHVQALKEHLSDYTDVKFIPIVVFSIKADLKIKVTSEVVYTTKLLKTIKNYDKEVISNGLKEELYSKILSLNIKSKKVEKEHIAAIHQYKKREAQDVGNYICPKCGGTLISRKSKFGYFKVCSNYPKCQFKMDI